MARPAATSSDSDQAHLFPLETVGRVRRRARFRALRASSGVSVKIPWRSGVAGDGPHRHAKGFPVLAFRCRRCCGMTL